MRYKRNVWPSETKHKKIETAPFVVRLWNLNHVWTHKLWCNIRFNKHVTFPELDLTSLSWTGWTLMVGKTRLLILIASPDCIWTFLSWNPARHSSPESLSIRREMSNMTTAAWSSCLHFSQHHSRFWSPVGSLCRRWFTSRFNVASNRLEAAKHFVE